MSEYDYDYDYGYYTLRVMKGRTEDYARIIGLGEDQAISRKLLLRPFLERRYLFAFGGKIR